MNVFVLDRDPRTAARYHCDQHVPKMILESAQLLCTEAHRLGVAQPTAYKPTHQNHPCAVWLRDNPTAAHWLHNLICKLAEQHKLRFGTRHKSEWTGRVAACEIWDHHRYKPMNNNFDDLEFELAMPDEFKDSDEVVAYREYYKAKNLKWQLDRKVAMKYTNVDWPDWLVLP
jgi:hypothetical protein